MAPSVEQIKEKKALKILCATEAGKIVGIAPFRKTTQRSLKGKFSYKIIEPLTNGDTDYTGIILPNEKTKILTEFLKYLYNQKDWDMVRIPDLPQNSITIKLLKKISKKYLNPKIQKGIICPYISLPNSKEEFMLNLLPKFKRKLTKSLRKLEQEQGKVELKQYQELGSLEQTMELLFTFHQKRWNMKGEPGRFASKKERKVSVHTAKFFAEKDWLRFYFLIVNNKPVAAELNLKYKNTMYCHLKGFDPVYSKYRVGHLLSLKVIEECISNGLLEYDFMQGDEPYKFYWTKKYRQNINITIVNKRFSSQLIFLGSKFLELIALTLFSIRKNLKHFNF